MDQPAWLRAAWAEFGVREGAGAVHMRATISAPAPLQWFTRVFAPAVRACLGSGSDGSELKLQPGVETVFHWSVQRPGDIVFVPHGKLPRQHVHS